MTPVEELCARLDEIKIKNIKHRNYGYKNHVWWEGKDGVDWHAENRPSVNDPYVIVDAVITPEQAIAATVGGCDIMGLWHEWEQVLFANVSDEVAQDNLNECVHELLDKAATVGVGTCRRVFIKDWLWECSECHSRHDNGHLYNFCPNCGRRIEVDE